MSLGPSLGLSSGLWGNVSGALLCGRLSAEGADAPSSARIRSEHEAAAELLAQVFADCLIVGDELESDRLPGRPVASAESDGPLGALLLAAEAARCERVLVVGPGLAGLTLDLVLALLAWPEADAVVSGPLDDRDDGASYCAVYRREALLSVVRELAPSGLASRGELHERLDARCVSLETLGVSDLLVSGCAGEATKIDSLGSEAG